MTREEAGINLLWNGDDHVENKNSAGDEKIVNGPGSQHTCLHKYIHVRYKATVPVTILFHLLFLYDPLAYQVLLLLNYQLLVPQTVHNINIRTSPSEIAWLICKKFYQS